MTLTSPTPWLALAAILLALARPAAAGTELATATREVGDPAAEARTGRALLDGRRLRIDTHDGRRAIVYRGDRGVVWLIDHRKKSYVQIEQPTPEEVAAQARARLEALPPDERAAARGALDAAADDALELRETGERDRIQGIPCEELEVVREGTRLADVCRASYAEAGVAPESFAAVREVQALLEDSVAALLADGAGDAGLAALTSFGELDGVPLRVRTWSEGEPRSETRVTRIESKPIGAAAFEIPEGYRPRITINIRGSGG